MFALTDCFKLSEISCYNLIYKIDLQLMTNLELQILPFDIVHIVYLVNVSIEILIVGHCHCYNRSISL